MQKSLEYFLHNVMPVVYSESFTSFLPSWMFVFLFPTNYFSYDFQYYLWIKVTRMESCLLFLFLMESHLTFHHSIWYYLWTCHTWPLLCWDTFPLKPLWGLSNHRWMFNFVIFFCSSIKMKIWFVIFFLLMWCHI